MKHPGIPHQPHDPIIDPATGEACFGCRVGSGTSDTFELGAAAKVSRAIDRKFVNRPMKDPSWENGVAGEHRPGGTFVPYKTASGKEISIKEYGERRRVIDAARRDIANDPRPSVIA